MHTYREKESAREREGDSKRARQGEKERERERDAKRETKRERARERERERERGKERETDRERERTSKLHHFRLRGHSVPRYPLYTPERSGVRETTRHLTVEGGAIQALCAACN